MDKATIQSIATRLSGHLTEWDAQFLTECIAKLDAGQELGERDLRALEAFQAAADQHGQE